MKNFYSYRIVDLSQPNENKGFTLVEIMIVVAIIAVLAAIVYPNYHRYVVKTHRADAMAELTSIVGRIKEKKLSTGNNDNIELEYVLGEGYDPASFDKTYSVQGKDFYTIELQDLTDPNSPIKIQRANLETGQWQVVAKPIADSIVAEDGELTINFNGRKCRISGSLENCGQVRSGRLVTWNDNF